MAETRNGKFTGRPPGSGLNVVHKRQKDGSTKTRYYHRKTGIALGSDRSVALEQAAVLQEAQVFVPVASPLACSDRPNRCLSLGDAGEGLLRAELQACGLVVLMPTGGTAYDLAVDDGRRFWRIQVKTRQTTRRNRDSIHFQLGGRSGTAGIGFRDYVTAGVDLFAFVYWPLRSIIFRPATTYAKRSATAIPLAAFKDSRPFLHRWMAAAHNAPRSSANGYANRKQDEGTTN